MLRLIPIEQIVKAAVVTVAFPATPLLLARARYLIQIDSLKKELEGKIAEEQKLIEEKVVYVARVKDLAKEVKSLQSLKSVADSEVSKKTEEITEYVSQVESLKEEVEKLTTVQEKKMEEKEGYESKIKDLELQLESMNNLKNESEMQLEKKGLEILEFLILIQNLKEELETKSIEQDKTMKVKDLEFQLEYLNNLKSESEIQLEKKGSEISERLILSQSLKEELDSKSKVQEKTVEEKESFESKVKDLESQLKNVANLKIKSDTQLEQKCLEITELPTPSQSLKEELENKLKEQEKTMEEKEGYDSKVKDVESQLESLKTLKNESGVHIEKKELLTLNQSQKETIEIMSKDQAKTVEEKNQSLKDELETKSNDQAKTLEEKESHESTIKDLELKLKSLTNLKNKSKCTLRKKALNYRTLDPERKSIIRTCK
nr:COP1-interactive protein 1 [Tanacetum cinerariifolium]